MQWRPIGDKLGRQGRLIRLPWGKLGLLAIALSATLWSAGTLGAWLFVKYHRHIPEVGYTDLLLPYRWPEYRIHEGNFYINRAGQLLEQGDINAALYELRAGVARSPANTKGRTTLAALYVSSRRPDLAQDLLLDGLGQLAGDPAYLQATLAFLLDVHEDAKLLEVAGQLLDSPARASIHPLAAVYAATAAYYRGDYDRAEDLVTSHQLHLSAEGGTLLAQIEWERGYPELALLRLQEQIALWPENSRARMLLADYYRALGRTRELESALVEQLVGDPLSAVPRMEYLRLLRQRGELTKFEHEATDYLDQFRHDPVALMQFADFAATTGQPALVRRIQQVSPTRPENNGALALLVPEAHLVAGEYQTALDLIAGLGRDYPAWTRQFAPVFNGLQAVAFCGLGRKDEARLSLDRLCAQKNLRADNLVAVSNRLAALGARDLALTALNRAVEADPLNQTALTNLIRLELDTDSFANLPVHLTRFLQARRPSREILSRAYAALGSDRHLFLPAQAGQLALLRAALASRRP